MIKFSWPSEQSVVVTVPNSGALIAKTDRIAVQLIGLKVKKLLKGPDAKNRDDATGKSGTISFIFDGLHTEDDSVSVRAPQQHAFAWKNGKREEDDTNNHLNGQILYLGTPRKFLRLLVHVVETESHGPKSTSFLELAGSVAVATPGPGWIVGGAIGLLEKLIGLFRKKAVIDRSELTFFGTLVGAYLKEGQYTIGRKLNTEDDLEVTFEIKKFPAVKKADQKQALPGFLTLESVNLSIPEDWEKTHLDFELTLGEHSPLSWDGVICKGDFGLTKSLGMLPSTFYCEDASRGIPFFVSAGAHVTAASANDDDELKSLLKQASTFGKGFAETAVAKRKTDLKSQITDIASAAQSFGNLVSEFVKKDRRIGSKSGIFIPPGATGPKGFGSSFEAELCKIILLDQVSNAQATFSFRWEREHRQEEAAIRPQPAARPN